MYVVFLNARKFRNANFVVIEFQLSIFRKISSIFKAERHRPHVWLVWHMWPDEEFENINIYRVVCLKQQR